MSHLQPRSSPLPSTGTALNSNGKLKGKGKKKLKKNASKEFIATPKKGYKAGILVNGRLVKFQTDKKIKKAIKSKKKGATALPYTLKKIKANTLVDALFVPIGQPFAQSLGVALTGLGSSIKVTNLSPATFTGLAESNVGVKSIAFQNATNGATGKVSGTDNWSAAIPLATGDNKLFFTITALDGTVYTTETTVTHYANLDFTTPLGFSDDVLFINEGKNVVFSIALLDSTGATVTLVSVDANGQPDGKVSKPMLDNGTLPDEIQQDGVFSTQVTINNPEQAFLRYRVRVDKPTGTYFSETASIWVTSHLSAADLQAAVDIANGVEAQYLSLAAQAKSDEAIFVNVAATLKTNPNVGAVGVGPLGGIWWITQKGILGQFSPDKPGQKASGRAELAAQAASVPPYHPPFTLSPYSTYDTQYLSGVSGMPVVASLTPAAANRVKSKKGVIISPYISNPYFPTSSFGKNDDYFVPWQTLKTKGGVCTMEATDEFLDNGTIGVTLDTFKNLERYGFIHISTHGDNLYNGLLSLWNDVWGPNDFLKGSLSIVAIDSGLALAKKSDGTFDPAQNEVDILAKRLAIDAGGGLQLLPAFFSKYLKPLPNSLVVLSACRSSYNASLANAFLAKGAGAVLGYTDYVSTAYAQNTLNSVMTDMLADKTLTTAFANAVGTYGTDDKDKDPAKFTRFGAADLQFPSGGLENTSFEDAGLAPWDSVGDGRVIQQLGAAIPPDGSKMAIISTGLGFTTDSGSIDQLFCVPADATSIDLQWNFFSEEFLEYCGSVYQDFFQVDLCVVPDGGGAESCTAAFRAEVDSLCSGVLPAGVGFDRGGVYTTGWRPLSIPLASYAGKKVRLRLSAGDIGDSIYDTAILVDKIFVLPAPPS